jgi:two-component system KDP operon response regulator KdpE
MNARILVVDDEEPIHRFLRPALIASGFDMLSAFTGQQALELISTAAPDLILTELALPDMDGKEVIIEVRYFSRTPIIVLSARDREEEKIAALDLGANDYVQKPVAIGELMARIRATLRYRQIGVETLARFEVGGLVVDLAKRSARGNGVRASLSPKEFLLLSILAANPDRVVTNRQISTAVWGPKHGKDKQALRVLVSQLRSKMEKNAADPKMIVTEQGIGYRLNIKDRP